MIIEGLLNLIFTLLEFIFSPIQVPDLPEAVQSVIDRLVQIMADAVGLLGIFVNLELLKILLPVVIVIINLDRVWKLIMFILRKIPFLGIE